jgi:hypothetical protein
MKRLVIGCAGGHLTLPDAGAALAAMYFGIAVKAAPAINAAFNAN